MLPNVNPETGIRYGMISFNAINPDVMDDIYTHGENLSHAAAWEDYKIENNLSDDSEDIDEHQQQFSDGYYEDDDVYAGELDGVTYQTSSFGLWVFHSPNVVKCRLCSPCVPDCGNLDSPDDNGYDCYGIPDDWRYVPE